MATAPLAQINITDTGLSAAGKGMRLGEIRAAIPELEAACNRAIDASEAFGDLCKLIGLQASVDPSVIKTFVAARCNDRIKKTADKAEQLDLLFSEIE